MNSILNAETSTRILEADYRFAQPPAKPIVEVVPGDGKVTLYWDSRAEESVDPLSGLQDFQGYKIYRSQDQTFSDVFSITDGFGNSFLGSPLVQFDLDDDLSGFHPIEYLGRGVKYYMGDNTGIVHEFVDSTVTNGIRYYYAVVAFDSGTDEIPPTETQAVILRDPITGVLTFDVNTAEVIPGPMGSGISEALAGVNGIPNQVKGNSTGDLNIKVLDDLKVMDKLYSIDFIDNVIYNVLDSTGVSETFISKDTVFVELGNKNINSNSIKIIDPSNNTVNPSNYFVNSAAGRVRGSSPGSLPAGQEYTIQYRYYPIFKSSYLNYEDANPSFDGLKVYVQNEVDSKGAPSISLDFDNSGFNDDADVNLDISLVYSPTGNYPGTPKVPYRADWEIRWNDLDTLENGLWVNTSDSALQLPSFSDLVLCPFTIVNTTENIKANYLVNEANDETRGNGQWDWGEGIIIRPTEPESAAEVSYYVEFNLPPDSLGAPILPKSGDIYSIKTNKPFLKGDKYTFETKKSEFDAATVQPEMNDIYVVPNPYVAFSDAEEPGRTSDKRGEGVLQFRNLPPLCTIRIYTIMGELVQTIMKDDLSSMATWDLLSFEGQRVAYGVYIYHVDAPGVGEKIGRFAVIK